VIRRQGLRRRDLVGVTLLDLAGLVEHLLPLLPFLLALLPLLCLLLGLLVVLEQLLPLAFRRELRGSKHALSLRNLPRTDDDDLLLLFFRL